MEGRSQDSATYTIDLLPEITRRILSVSDPERIILFGSYARGDVDSDSDIDLLVVVDKAPSLRAEDLRLRRSLRGLMVPVDIIVTTTDLLERYGDTIGYIYKIALSEGKVLYERTPAI